MLPGVSVTLGNILAILGIRSLYALECVNSRSCLCKYVMSPEPVDDSCLTSRN